MKIFLDERQHNNLSKLIRNDPEYHQWFLDNIATFSLFEFLSFDTQQDKLNDVRKQISVDEPDDWKHFIKQKYKITFRTSANVRSPYWLGSISGTKSRINMFLLQL